MNSDTSSSNCSCSSCEAYRHRKRKLRRRILRRKERRLSEDSDKSGTRAAEDGYLTDRFGKYGVIDADDRDAKQSEFYLWLVETRGCSGEEALGSYDDAKWFDV